MRLIARFLSLVLAATAVAVIGASAPSAQAGDAEMKAAPAVMKVCAEDKYKGYCLTRSSYDSSFNNDKYCWDDREGEWHTGQCYWVVTMDFEDKISSFDNDTPNYWKFYEDRKYGGYVLCIEPWGYDGDIGNNTSMEDDISSIKKMGTTKPHGCDKTIG